MPPTTALGACSAAAQAPNGATQTMLAPDPTRYVLSASRAIAAEPFEGVERVLERVAEWRDGHRHLAAVPRAGWERELHVRLGAPWPCAEHAEFGAVWADAVAALRERDLAVGRGAFGGWDDGDPGLVRAAWCVVRHRRPEVVVETGVGRGLTTRAILEALERNGSGRLLSVDLPPLLAHDLADQTAVAVPPDARERWTLLRGSSRRVLPGLVRGLERVDMFVHDSMHTTRNVRFELEQIWPALAQDGVALVDDIDKNAAFGQFAAAHRDAAALTAAADDGAALFGCLLR